MGSGNSGEQLLKILVRMLLFIIKLIPGFIRLIIRGVKAIIAMFQDKKAASILQKPVEVENFEQKAE